MGHTIVEAVYPSMQRFQNAVIDEKENWQLLVKTSFASVLTIYQRYTVHAESCTLRGGAYQTFFGRYSSF